MKTAPKKNVKNSTIFTFLIIYLLTLIIWGTLPVHAQTFELSGGKALEWNSDIKGLSYRPVTFQHARNDKETWLVLTPMSQHVLFRYGVEASIYTTYHCSGNIELSIITVATSSQPQYIAYISGTDPVVAQRHCNDPRNRYGSHLAEYGKLYFFKEEIPYQGWLVKLTMYFQKVLNF